MPAAIYIRRLQPQEHQHLLEIAVNERRINFIPWHSERCLPFLCPNFQKNTLRKRILILGKVLSSIAALVLASISLYKEATVDRMVYKSK